MNSKTITTTIRIENENQFRFRAFPEGRWVEDAKISSEDSSDQLGNDVPQQDFGAQYLPKIGEYEVPILNKLRQIDKSFHFDFNYCNSIQTNLTRRDRDIITQNILKTGVSCGFSHRIIGLASKIFDRIIQTYPLHRDELNLNAATCLFIANKIEGHEIDDACQVLAQRRTEFKESDIIQQELTICNILNYNIRFVTPFDFLELFLKKDENLDDYNSYRVLKKLTKAIIYCAMITETSNTFTSEDICMYSLEIANCLMNNNPIPTKSSGLSKIYSIALTCFRDPSNLITLIFPNFSQLFSEAPT